MPFATALAHSWLICPLHQTVGMFIITAKHHRFGIYHSADQSMLQNFLQHFLRG